LISESVSSFAYFYHQSFYRFHGQIGATTFGQLDILPNTKNPLQERNYAG